jgi:hypothetical protein
VTLIHAPNQVICGYIAAHPPSESLIVSFRGTTNLDNWINNLLIAQPDVPFPLAPKGVKVHYGFLNSYKKIRKAIWEAFKSQYAAFPGYKVRFMGHSLGGALAVLAAMDLLGAVSFSPKDTMIYTVNMPRVGNPKFAEWVTQTFDSQNVRVVNENDFVPRLPPRFVNFRHSGTEVWVKTGGKETLVCEANGESNACSMSIKFGWDLGKHSLAWGLPVGGQTCGKVSSISPYDDDDVQGDY